MPRRRIIPVFVPHLGCPHQCVFCNQREISGSSRPADPEAVSELLSSAQSVSACAELAFYGGSFTAIPKERQSALLAAAQPFLESGFLSSIRVSTRPDCISPAALELLWRYGVRTVELGVQSMDDEVLQSAGRGHRAADTVRAAALVRERGFQLILQMMTGLPGSDDRRDMETAERLAALGPDGVRVYPTVVLRDTPLAALWRQGRYRAQTVEEAVRCCAPIVLCFAGAGIPILRLGLNPTEELSGGEVLAGAYHPALGELCYARCYRNEAERQLAARPAGEKRLRLLVAPGCISKMTGQKRENLRYLRERFGLEEIQVREAPIPPGALEIQKIL